MIVPLSRPDPFGESRDGNVAGGPVGSLALLDADRVPVGLELDESRDLFQGADVAVAKLAGAHDALEVLRGGALELERDCGIGDAGEVDGVDVQGQTAMGQLAWCAAATDLVSTLQ